MHPTQNPFRVGLFLVILTLPAVRLSAQNIFLAEDDGKMVPVTSMNVQKPCITVDGKLTYLHGDRRAFAKAEEYKPVLVSVRNLVVRKNGRRAQGRVINNEFHFNADFETPYRLENAFFVLEMKTEREGALLFAYEIGTLEPRTPRLIRLTIPLTEQLGRGRHKIHVFAGGAEVLNTDMPAEQRDKILDRMTAKRIRSLETAEPAPFVGPAPEYPDALRKSKLPGRVVVTLHVDAAGRISDPVVKEATNPAFADAALAAVREWRFLPRVKDGHPIESQVSMPFEFAAPAD